MRLGDLIKELQRIETETGSDIVVVTNNIDDVTGQVYLDVVCNVSRIELTVREAVVIT